MKIIISQYLHRINEMWLELKLRRYVSPQWNSSTGCTSITILLFTLIFELSTRCTSKGLSGRSIQVDNVSESVVKGTSLEFWGKQQILQKGTSSWRVFIKTNRTSWIPLLATFYLFYIHHNTKEIHWKSKSSRELFVNQVAINKSCYCFNFFKHYTQITPQKIKH